MDFEESIHSIKMEGHMNKYKNHTLLGWFVAKPTKQNIRHIKKTAPETIPSDSGLECKNFKNKVSAIKLKQEILHFFPNKTNRADENKTDKRSNTHMSSFSLAVPFFPKSFPDMPLFSM